MGKSLSGKELGRGLVQRPDGRYQARAQVGGVKVEIYDTNLANLKKRFEEEKAKVLLKEHNTKPNLTLSEFAQDWFTNYKSIMLKTETSRATYWRRIQNTYVTILGTKRLESITQGNIQLATNELIEKGYKVRTIREALGMLRECFDVAVVNSLCKTNPCVRINLPNENEAMAERRVLDKFEIDLLLEVIAGDYYEEVYKLLLLTGMRIGELTGLQWQDIDFKGKVINVRRSMSLGYVNGKKIETLVPPKTSKSYRAIPFFGETEELFKNWKVKQDAYKAKLGERWRMRTELGDLVFSTTLGSPLTRFALTKSIAKIEKDMQATEDYHAKMEGRQPRTIEHIHPHSFRHTFATRCFERGMDAIVVQRIMGHSSSQITQIYTHLLNDKRQEEVNKIGNFFD